MYLNPSSLGIEKREEILAEEKNGYPVSFFGANVESCCETEAKKFPNSFDGKSRLENVGMFRKEYPNSLDELNGQVKDDIDEKKGKPVSLLVKRKDED